MREPPPGGSLIVVLALQTATGISPAGAPPLRQKRAPSLVLEVIPSFEADDDRVVAELAESVADWREALGRHRRDGAV
jgi:hypothetical protein